MQEPKIEEISDDELMRPPLAPPPKPRGRPRTKKQAKPTENPTPRASKVKIEKNSLEAKEERPVRITRTKSKKAKESTKESESEAGSEQETEASSLTLPKVVVKCERLTNEEVAQLTGLIKPQRKSGQSEASSVYEDAISDDRLVLATFVKPSAPAANMPQINNTFAVPSPNATFDVVQSPTEVNYTYTLPQSKAPVSKVPSHNTPSTMHDSLMTEDRSDEDEGNIEPRTNVIQPPLKTVITESIYKHGKPMTKKPELFNPNIQSPIKAKIQAFEKAAKTGGASFMSPANTRLKTRIGTSSLQKLNAGTPKVGTSGIPSSIRTPIQLHTATSAPSLLFQKPTSTSKVTTIQKKTGAIPKTTRDCSVDRLDKATAAEKKKRDERARQAQWNREQTEKERKLRLEQKLAEDEERMKKLKQQQEKLRLQKMYEQQKREEVVRLEQQKRANELEAIKSKHNESLQRKAIHMNMLKSRTEHHDFTILHTDDSTDDEGKMNKKRPVPPSWSRGKLIDYCSLFLCELIFSFYYRFQSSLYFTHSKSCTSPIC